MELELGPAGPFLDGVPVTDAASLQATLGPPSRSVPVERAIPGAEDQPIPYRVSIWDQAGLLAAPGLLIVAVGDNLLDEPLWPQSRFAGVVLVGGIPLDPATMARDPLREQRYTDNVGNAQLTVITDWRGAPTKVLWAQRPD